jgi:hypothetical protein
LAKERAELERRRLEADQSSEHRRELSSLGSASKYNHAPSRYGMHIPRLSEADAREITSIISNSFMTMDIEGIPRLKTVQGATTHITAYLIKNSRIAGDPMLSGHRVA